MTSRACRVLLQCFWLQHQERSPMQLFAFSGLSCRTAPNRYKYDNCSTWGNTNPYTGERGYRYKRQCRYN